MLPRLRKEIRERPVFFINSLKAALVTATSLGIGFTDFQIDTIVGTVATVLVIFSGLTSWESEQVAKLIKCAEIKSGIEANEDSP